MSMTCDTVRDRIQEDLDGELSVLHRTRLREHLAGCPGCEAAAERLRRLAGALAADVVELPRDFRHAVMAALPAAAWE
ncbi:MAG: anti-sigma factor family protein, partial [Thermoanaerobaculia bacterium]